MGKERHAYLVGYTSYSPLLSSPQHHMPPPLFLFQMSVSRLGHSRVLSGVRQWEWAFNAKEEDEDARACIPPTSQSSTLFSFIFHDHVGS